MGARPLRVLIGKPGLDGHDKAAKIVTLLLRDAGMEVVYTGLHKTPEEIARAAIQEDVDVVGLSIHSGAHVSLAKRVLDALAAAPRPVVVGGPIPAEDAERLRAMGVRAVLGGGTPFDEVVRVTRELGEERRGR